MNTFPMLSIALTFLGLSVSPAHANVSYASQSGFITENTQNSSADPATTWNALVNQVDNWWPKDHSWWRGTFSIDTSAGGCFCERSGSNSAEHMRISLVLPPSTLVMTGGLGPLQGMGVYGALTWKLDAIDTGTRVTLTYRVQGYAPPEGFADLAPVVDEVQSQQLNSLIRYIANHSGE